MSQAVSCRPLETKVRVHFQVSPCETCAVRSGTGTGLSLSNKDSPLSVSFQQCSTLIHPSTTDAMQFWHSIWHSDHVLKNARLLTVDGIATGYGLDCPGIESRWGQYFSHPCTKVLRPTQPPVQGESVSYLGVKRPGRVFDH
jgi:hypothetical protein